MHDVIPRPRRFRSRRAREKYNKSLITFFQLGLSLAGALVLLLSQISHITDIQVGNLIIDGNSVTKDADIQAVVENGLSGAYLSLFPKSNIALFSRQNIEGAILETFPRIKSATLSLVDLQTLSLDIEERDAVGVYCASDSCMFVDEDGLLFAPAPEFSGDIFFRYTYADGNAVFGVGEQLISAAEFHNLELLGGALISFGLTPKALHVDDSKLEYTLDVGSRIILKRDLSDIETTLQNLQSVLESNELSTDLGDERTLEIDYIDLRYGNKVFYKFNE